MHGRHDYHACLMAKLTSVGSGVARHMKSAGGKQGQRLWLGGRAGCGMLALARPNRARFLSRKVLLLRLTH